MGNTIRDRVFTVLQKQPGIPFSIKGVHAKLQDCAYEQVANSLADLVLLDERVVRTARGVYMYDGVVADDAPAATPKMEKLLRQETPFAKDEDDEEGRYFSQVGTALNGDLIITRDSDGVAYRATPL